MGLGGLEKDHLDLQIQMLKFAVSMQGCAKDFNLNDSLI
jgi:hypothetical protein